MPTRQKDTQTPGSPITKQAQRLWFEVLSQIEDAQEGLDSEAPWFRGQPQSTYKLLPSLLRGQAQHKGGVGEVNGAEFELFHEFSARANDLDQLAKDDWDILFTMQHYGTPTRLLDWTSVLSVAVYFAILGVDPLTADSPPCVWILNPQALNKSHGWGADVVDPRYLGYDRDADRFYGYRDLLEEYEMGWRYPIAILPRRGNLRMRAQHALFTIHGDKPVPLEAAPRSERFLKKITIPFEALPGARRFLEHAGIDHYSLLADLESLSRHLREKFFAQSKNTMVRPRGRKG